ncbi:Protein CBG10315 [Caenorhabditis briggsae]|uniref:Protein CBG10315 n=1 Tax=Caenorhabditis briggsae TaxID=6238 RepID=A8XAM1_CAEBR|nr:Protein CBG10315 [Caenorhabditis briggsae]CAP29686.2 Protein CBG10315 [Caenorhabditis briggsae]
MALHLKSTILLALLAATVSADFSASFRNFINATYGEARLTALARTDLGADGSYGGGNHDGLSQTNKRPIILVHGITNTAGTFTPQRNYFKSNGWTDETVYATTYGAGPAVNVINVKMECGFVQQIRNMIEAVYQFTGQKVDVIGYSLGSPIARKAIMGGICVDNVNVDLGGPLTNKVETYVSVADSRKPRHHPHQHRRNAEDSSGHSRLLKMIGIFVNFHCFWAH